MRIKLEENKREKGGEEYVPARHAASIEVGYIPRGDGKAGISKCVALLILVLKGVVGMMKNVPF